MLSQQKEGKKQKDLNIDVVETYEEYINESRERFEELWSENKEFNIEISLKFIDELAMRLEYYKEIKRYRKTLKEKGKSLKQSEKHLYDVTLKIKQPQQTKEFYFAERQNNEVLMILKRIREDLE